MERRVYLRAPEHAGVAFQVRALTGTPLRRRTRDRPPGCSYEYSSRHSSLWHRPPFRRGCDNERVPHISEDTRVVAAPERQLSTELGGEVVILDIDKGEYFGLANVGTLIWNMLQTPRRVSEIVDRIVTDYDVRRDTAEEDLQALLADLAARGLIDVDDSPPA